MAKLESIAFVMMLMLSCVQSMDRQRPNLLKARLNDRPYSEAKSGLKTRENIPICESDWSGFGNFCYKYFQGPFTYVEAQYKCAKVDAYLVDIQNETEQAFVNGLFQHFGNSLSYYWTGLNRIQDVNGAFKWDRTGAEANYTNWGAIWFGYRRGRDCVNAVATWPLERGNDLTGKWIDGHCHRQSTFAVCKKAAN